MANLKAVICVRTKTTEGKRAWVLANGKTGPPDSHYVRYYQGEVPRYVCVGFGYHDAELAQQEWENRLQAASIGAALDVNPLRAHGN